MAPQSAIIGLTEDQCRQAGYFDIEDSAIFRMPNRRLVAFSLVDQQENQAEDYPTRLYLPALYTRQDWDTESGARYFVHDGHVCIESVYGEALKVCQFAELVNTGKLAHDAWREA